MCDTEIPPCIPCAEPMQEMEDEGLPIPSLGCGPTLRGSMGTVGMCSPSYSRQEYNVARFFAARDVLDLINHLNKAARMAGDEAESLHGDEQVNRVKAKCSRMCGLSNRLIDLYVATIRAKLSRMVRRSCLGHAKGQELLNQHLGQLQTLVDQAFAALNLVQQAEEARVEQAKQGAGDYRENLLVDCRSPTGREGRESFSGCDRRSPGVQDCRESIASLEGMTPTGRERRESLNIHDRPSPSGRERRSSLTMLDRPSPAARDARESLGMLDRPSPAGRQRRESLSLLDRPSPAGRERRESIRILDRLSTA
ncbi:hypothetical protein Agub_g12384, partial [Astrephomene gubernaculifera]